MPKSKPYAQRKGAIVNNNSISSVHSYVLLWQVIWLPYGYALGWPKQNMGQTDADSLAVGKYSVCKITNPSSTKGPLRFAP